MQTKDEKRFANAGDARYLDKYFLKIRYLARKLFANSYNRSNNLHTANKLKFELAGTGIRRYHFPLAGCVKIWLIRTRVVFSMQRMLYDCDKTLQLQTNDLDVDTMYEIRVKEAARSAVLFISIVTNSRYKSFSIPVFDRFLEKFFERLETRNSKLEPRNSILDSRKHRVSRIEFRVETVNLHLTGTVSPTEFISVTVM